MAANSGTAMLGLLIGVQLLGLTSGQAGDVMMGTPFGELPNPIVTAPIGGNQGRAGGHGQQGGGLDSFSHTYDPSTSSAGFNIDPSTIAGIASGQTIYLSGNVGDQVLSDVPLNIVSSEQLNQGQGQHQGQPQGNEPRFVTQNEAFTALGQVGKQVRVLDTSQAGGGSSTSPQGHSMDMPTLPGSGAIDMSNIHGSGPMEIVGIADMTSVDAQGNPVFSFNPGTGHASELAALNSALQGSAVDMTNFLPPPLDTAPPSAQNASSGATASGLSADSGIPSPQAINQQLDIILNEGTHQSGSDMNTIVSDMKTGMDTVNSMTDSSGIISSGSTHNSLADMVNPASLSSLSSGTIITQEQLFQMLQHDQNTVHNNPQPLTSSLSSEMNAGSVNVNTPVDMTAFLPPVDVGVPNKIPSVSFDGMDASVTASVNKGHFGNQRQSNVLDGMDATSKTSMDLILGDRTNVASVDGMDMAVKSNVNSGFIGAKQQSAALDGADVNLISQRNIGGISKHETVTNVDGSDGTYVVTNNVLGMSKTNTVNVDGGDVTFNTNVELGSLGSAQQEMSMEGSGSSGLPPPPINRAFSGGPTAITLTGGGSFVSPTFGGISMPDGVAPGNVLSEGSISLNNESPISTSISTGPSVSQTQSKSGGISTDTGVSNFSKSDGVLGDTVMSDSTNVIHKGLATNNVMQDTPTSFSRMPSRGLSKVSPVVPYFSNSGIEATGNVVSDSLIVVNGTRPSGIQTVGLPSIRPTVHGVSLGGLSSGVARDNVLLDTNMSFNEQPMGTAKETSSPVIQTVSDFKSTGAIDSIMSDALDAKVNSLSNQLGAKQNIHTENIMQNDMISRSNIGSSQTQTERNFPSRTNKQDGQTFVKSGTESTRTLTSVLQPSQSDTPNNLLNERMRRNQLANEQSRRNNILNEQMRQNNLVNEQVRRNNLMNEQMSKNNLVNEQMRRNSLVNEQMKPSNLVNEQMMPNNIVNEQIRRNTEQSRKNVNSESTNALNKVGSLDVPHVNDLTADGIYPFEGIFDARDATLAEGRPTIMDMTSVMEDQTNISDTLHLENTFAPLTTPNEVGNASIGGEPPLTGTNGGPITNMVGAKPIVEKSASLNPDIGLVAVGTGKVGKDISARPNMLFNSAPTFRRNVASADAGGGFSIGGSELNSVLNKISLPDKAFIQAQSDVPVVDTPKVQTPVDMSFFIPPQIEGPAEPQATSQFLSVNKGAAKGVDNTPSATVVDLSSQTRDRSREQTQTQGVPSRVVSHVNPLQGVREANFLNWAMGRNANGGGASVSNKVATAFQQTKAADASKLTGQPTILPTAWRSSGSGLTGGVALPNSVAVSSPPQSKPAAVRSPPQSQHESVNSQPQNQHVSSRFPTPRKQTQPIVGSIFGSSVDNTPEAISKKFLESSGLTNEPAVDFMTSFLNPSTSNKPSRTVDLGQKKVQIVPFGSDVSNVGRNANNMFIVGRGQSAPSEPIVDQFGVADITRRKQQLNSNQWNAFMNSVSADATIRTNSLPAYQTQNVIGTSETRPLNTGSNFVSTNIQPSLIVAPKPVVTHRRQSFNTGTGSNKLTTLFEAQGRTGHKSVSISLFPTSSRTGKAISKDKQNAGTTRGSQTVSSSVFGQSGGEQMATRNTLGIMDQTQAQVDPVNMGTSDMQGQLLKRKYVGSQQTAANSNQFANTLRQGLDGGAKGFPVMDAGFQTTGTKTTGKEKFPGFKAVGQGASNTGSTTDHSDFTLGQSVMISDGVVPDYVMDPNKGTVSVQDLKDMASSGFRLGEPVTMRKFQGSTKTAIGAGSSSNPIIQTNMNVNAQTETKVSKQGNQGIGVSVSQGGASTSMSNALNKFLSQTRQGQENVLPGSQVIEPTLFTSGNRPAVFGPASGDERTASRVIARINKPAKATRMGILGPVHECRYRPDAMSKYFFIYKNGKTEHRFRCALGTAFDEMTCECSIRVSDHDDCLEVHMDFNNGKVEDSSVNHLPIGNVNVEITNGSSPIAGIALFGGDGKLKIWRYQNYDFRDHIMLKVQFRPGPGGDRIQPLLSNCGNEAPSVAILYDGLKREVVLVLQTTNDTRKELRFVINPNEWNDVTYIYDGMEFIGIVNGVRRYVSRQDPHLLGIIGGEIKSVPAEGLIEIRDAPLSLGQCASFGNYIGAMVDIQVYTCIPRDFRLE